MGIAFNKVPQSARASKIYVELLGVKRSLASLFIPPTVLLVGMYDPLKTSTVDYQPIQVVSKDDVGNKAGFGSHAHRQALKLPSGVFAQGGGVWWLPIPEESGGSASDETITFTGTAGSNGSIPFLVGGDRVVVPVQKDDTPTEIAAALDDEITALRDVSVTSDASAAITTLASKFKGTAGNQILVVQNPNGAADEALNPSGVTVALENADGYLDGGATDPDLENAFFDTNGDDKLGDRWYTTITMPFTDATNIGHYDELGKQRSDPAVNRFFGAHCGYVQKTYAEALAVPATINSEWIGPIWDDRYYAPAFELGAELCGIIANEESLAPNRPYKTIELDVVYDTSIDNRKQVELDALFRAGMSYCKVTGNSLKLGDIALSYRTNDSGGASEEWFDAVSLYTRQAKSYSIEQLFLSDEYARSVAITDDDVAGSSNIAIAPKDIVSALGKLIEDLWLEFAWTKNGDTVLKTISAEINAGFNGRIDSVLTDDEAKALRIIAVSYQYLY